MNQMIRSTDLDGGLGTKEYNAGYPIHRRNRIFSPTSEILSRNPLLEKRPKMRFSAEQSLFLNGGFFGLSTGFHFGHPPPSTLGNFEGPVKDNNVDTVDCRVPGSLCNKYFP